MISAQIRGKEFPLCLTVAALDRINAKCGGMGKINDFLFPKKSAASDEEAASLDLYARAKNLAWLLGLLIQEGEENRIVGGQFSSSRPERRAVPGPEEVMHLLKLGEALQFGDVVANAINESLRQDIEAAHSKNVENAEQG